MLISTTTAGCGMSIVVAFWTAEIGAGMVPARTEAVPAGRHQIVIQPGPIAARPALRPSTEVPAVPSAASPSQLAGRGAARRSTTSPGADSGVVWIAAPSTVPTAGSAANAGQSTADSPKQSAAPTVTVVPMTAIASGETSRNWVRPVANRVNQVDMPPSPLPEAPIPDVALPPAPNEPSLTEAPADSSEASPTGTPAPVDTPAAADPPVSSPSAPAATSAGHVAPSSLPLWNSGVIIGSPADCPVPSELAQRYQSIYDSIPFSRAEYEANPSYRHDATMELLFGQMRPTVIQRSQVNVRVEDASQDNWWGVDGPGYYYPRSYQFFSPGYRVYRSF
jgi:hypothetical protein